MRFFAAACLLGLIVASVGCMTKNWSSPLFSNQPAEEENIEEGFPVWQSRGVSDEIFGTGVSGTARQVERNLGIKSRR